MTREDARRVYADEIARIASLTDTRVIGALARVAREQFLGDGPWLVRGDRDSRARLTSSDDPTEILTNVSVALDAGRDLYNGAPSVVAPWLEALAVSPGDRVLHIGCGTGYYAALLAELTGPHGHVDAIEVDEDLAARARTSLAAWPWTRVNTTIEAALVPGAADVLLVHAGATHVLTTWLDALSPSGRMLVPLTCRMPGMSPTLGKGMMLFVTRDADAWRAKMLGMVAIYSLQGLRDSDRERALGAAFMRGGWPSVSSLRRDTHAASADCWLHADGACLSSAPASN